MAYQKPPHAPEKRKRSKKNKSRTAISSSDESESENESDVETKKKVMVDEPVTPPKKAKEEKKEKQKKNKTPTSAALPADDSDISMPDQEDVDPEIGPAGGNSEAKVAPREDFGSIYLRRVTAELADDLDKVREANDFTNRSLPMLVHALRQGESVFSVEERRRVVEAGNA